MITFDHLTSDDLTAAALSLGLPPDAFTPCRLAYLAARVDDSGGPDACWPWVGPRQGAGYGIASVGGSTRGPHRLVHVLFNGPLASPELLVRHDCDFRPCCNPAHLRPGTHRDNSADAIARGRHPGRVLDDSDVEIILCLIDRSARGHLRRTGKRMTRPELFAFYAEPFGVTPGWIGTIYDEARRRAASVSAQEGRG